MKQKIIKFFHTPKKVATLSLVLAVAVGIVGYITINKAPVYQFAKASSGTIASAGTASLQNLSLGFLASGRIKTISVHAGDTVKKDAVLATLDNENATGVLNQAKAAYANAQANYKKVISGATGPTIDVAKSAVNTASVNLDEATKQQATFVANAHRNLLNSTITPVATSDISQAPPVITGTYTKDREGVLTINVYQTSDGGYFSLSGLATGEGKINKTIPEPMGDTGLSILFPASNSYINPTWTVTIPNTNAPNYLANYNAYQSALETQSQVLASAKATLDQANASLTALVTSARPEDVAVAQASVDAAKGALEIAQAGYNNTIITAPSDGTVTSVSISSGQIASPNSPAILFQGTQTTKNVAVEIPNTALINRDGKNYVLAKSGNGATLKEVTVGVSDGVNSEIISGLNAGDEVVVH